MAKKNEKAKELLEDALKEHSDECILCAVKDTRINSALAELSKHPEPTELTKKMDIWFGWCLENLDTLRASVAPVSLSLFDKVIESVKDIRNETLPTIDRQAAEITELKKGGWIPVSEKLPELKEVGKDVFRSSWVHVTDGREVIKAYYYDYTKREAKPNYATGKGWYCHGVRKTDITHWKPIILPKLDRKKKMKGV